jgi:hypothetical protein
MEMLDFFKCDEDFNNYLYVITGFSYMFRVSSSRETDNGEEYGVFYQVQPESKDDGFFDWYYFKMPDRQYFRTKTEAVLRFTIQWLQWHRSKGLSFFK